MTRLTRNTVFLLAAGGLGFYWLLWLIINMATSYSGSKISSIDIMTELSSALVLGATPVLVYSWFSTAIQAVKEGGREGTSFLSLGIFTLFLAITYQRIWITILRWLDRPEWMLSSPLGPQSAWLLFLGLILILAAPETTKGRIPPRNLWLVLLSAVLGTALFGITLGYFLGKAVAE